MKYFEIRKSRAAIALAVVGFFIVKAQIHTGSWWCSGMATAIYLALLCCILLFMLILILLFGAYDLFVEKKPLNVTPYVVLLMIVAFTCIAHYYQQAKDNIKPILAADGNNHNFALYLYEDGTYKISNQSPCYGCTYTGDYKISGDKLTLYEVKDTTLSHHFTLRNDSMISSNPNTLPGVYYVYQY